MRLSSTADRLLEHLEELRTLAHRRLGISPFGASDIRYEHFYQSLQATEAGQGVAMASVHMVADVLAAGRLCAPFGFSADGTHYLAVRRTDEADARTDAFIALIGSQMASGLAANDLGRDTPGAM